MTSQFEFEYGKILNLLWLIPIFTIFFIYVFKWKDKALKRFGNIELINKLTASTSRKSQIIKVIFILVSMVFIILSLARPKEGTKYEPVKREGVDILIALDLSYSMMAEDIKPNRLEKAKLEIDSFIDLQKNDRIGLIAFAGVPFLQCPLTLDHSAVKLFLSIMDVNLIPKPGTAIGDAILFAVEKFKTINQNNNKKKKSKSKVLVLITDGEDHQGEPLKAAEIAEKEGIVIYTIGVGSVKGVPLPVYSEQGYNAGFKKDKSGDIVTSKLDETTLEKIALQTNGKYFRATGGKDELTKIFEEISKMEKQEFSSNIWTNYVDRFQNILIFAIILLVVEVFIPDRRKIKREWQGRF